jgi:hypothetical protein
MCDISHAIHAECGNTHKIEKIGVILHKLKLFRCDILNVHIPKVQYYTSFNTTSVIF